MPCGKFSGLVIVSALLAACAAGCWPGIPLAGAYAEALRDEIKAMTADLSSTQDSDCGVTVLYTEGSCGGEALVYSRLTVPEEQLLAKVKFYNDFQLFTSGLFGRMCLHYVEVAVPTTLVSENGVCALKSSSDPRSTDLIYTVSGGVAGISHVVRITPEGRLYVSDQSGPENLLGFLDFLQSFQLNTQLLGWDGLPQINEEPQCCDGFDYAISYRGRTLSWLDGQDGVPDRLLAIASLVVSFEPALETP